MVGRIAVARKIATATRRATATRARAEVTATVTPKPRGKATAVDPAKVLPAKVKRIPRKRGVPSRL